MAGTVSVGGLMSGLDTNNIIEQLMSIETRQITQIEDRILLAEQRKIAVEYVTTQSISLSLSAYNLTKSRTFETKNAISSNEDILTASSSYSAATGNYTFTVGQLAQSGQTVSAGFVDSDETAVGEGTLSLDRGDRSLEKPTLLESLNGGSGVAPGAILVTDRAGNSKTVNLSTAITVNDVIERINNTSGISVTASLDSDGEKLVLTDSSGGSGQLKVEEVSGGSTAADLGILGNVSADSFTGSDIVYLTEDTRLEYVNDGLGAVFNDSGTDDIQIDWSGTTFDVDLSGAQTIGDVIDAINNDADNTGLTASLSTGGNSIEFSEAGVETTSLGSSDAAEALGISSESAVAVGAINTVLLRNLNGGSGVDANAIDITDRSGATATIDLSSANTVLDVINTINATGGVDVTASVNDEENGILIQDNTGGSNNLIIAENGGTTAEDLGIKTAVGGVSEDSVSGLHTHLKTFGYNTKLDTLNAGQGVPSGKFKITLGDGTSQTVDITDTDIDTVGEVIDAIKGKFSPTKLTVRINDTGDGLYLEDLTGGAGTFKVTEVDNGTTADALNILTTGDAGVIDGSFKHTIDIDANDTLDDVARAINSANIGVTASIMNDGSSVTPYRLVLSSDNSGRLSRILVDTVNAAGDDDISGFSFNETTRARDAAVLIGNSGSDSSPILLTSKENQLDNAISGLTLDLNSADPDKAVNVSVSRDIDGIEEGVNDFIEKFNTVMDTIDELTDYAGTNEDSEDSADSENEDEDETSEDFVTGLLMGNSTLRRIQDALYEMITSNVDQNAGNYSTFRSVGIKLGSKGRLSLDASEFRTAINSDFESVFDLFAESRNIASSDNGGWASLGGGISAESGFDLQDLLNGNNDPDDYNDAGGGNGFKAEHLSGGYINFNFGQLKTINKLRLFHIDNNTFAAEDYALKSFNVEYLNPRTNTYKTLLDVSNNTNAKTTYTLPEPVNTSSIRLKMFKTNDSGSPAYDRLVEFEAYENTGLASRLNNILKEYTSADGLLISEKDELDGKISDFNDQIEDLQERAEMTREQLLSDFSEMEQALAEMQSQSNVFMTQMASMMG